jgi:flavin reductase (DIM6/NTAB) family NADH-FMN oxidoreductase RutF
MTLRPKKTDFPTSNVRRYLEPGPIVLISSAHEGRTNIMTMGWHMVMEFTPSLVGCVISSASHSHRMIRRSGECVINLPTTKLTDVVVGVGNTTGAEIDKFAHFGLTAEKAERVGAPLIAECHACFECRLHDDAFVGKYDFFVFEVVKAHVAPTPKHPESLHYTGDGVFVVSGKVISRRSMFRPGML